jgi:hypothetical protein
MKTLTKLQLHELLKTKTAIAFLHDGEMLDIVGAEALNWFDEKQGSEVASYALVTDGYVFIAVEPDEYKEENLWQVGGTQ